MIQEKTMDNLLKWCNGKWLQHAGDIPVKNLAIDTRKIVQAEDTLFIAIGSPRRDGHSFIANAYEKGVRNFLVSKDIDVSTYGNADFIKVSDTVVALQQIAASHRKLFDIPVIGITGSNGKTIVKEWLYQLIGNDYNTLRSPKSYNSQIGVPLSVWLLEPEHEIGIFEAGISQPGEMQNLERVIQPSIGIFTNIGEAHSEGFLNRRQKINEKLMLFRNAKHLIYCKDYPELNECIAQYMSHARDREADQDKTLSLFTWSEKNEADLRITEIVKTTGKTAIRAIYNNVNLSVTIPFTDAASVENAIHCWCVLLLLKFDADVVEERMLSLHPVSMRLELKHGINDCTIINDSYNSDLTSLLIALDYLTQQKQHLHSTVILSDMLQIGKPDADLYEEVANLVNRRGVNRFIGIGPSLYKHKSHFRKHKRLRSIFFKSTDDFLRNFHLLTFNKETILLKGARIFRFEKINLLLEQQIHQTVLSINLSALTHNLNVFRSALKPHVKVMAMVKAFSYGSGSYEIASLLQYSGVDYLSVAYIDEGIALRKAGITLPVMVMSPDAISFDRMIAWKLEPEIFNFRSLNLFSSMARTLKVKDYPVHIKLDTGMHRLGFTKEEISGLVDMIESDEHLHIASVFSHLAASEDPSQDDFTAYQAQAFNEMYSIITGRLPYKSLRHICNSAAILRHEELHYDMVRLGIGLYGIDSAPGKKEKSEELRPIGTLKTTIAQVKTISPTETIGYGRKAVATSEMKIATISIGYADGYPRSLGNGKSYVLIHGKKAPVVGVVCMDMCMVDVTNIPEAKEGDEVIVFSPELPVTQLAEWAGTIPYEIMTGISQRVKRVYENEA